MAEASFISEVDGPIGWLRIHRPESRGALTRAMWLELPARIAALAQSPHVRVVVIRGSEGSFVAGADIAEFSALRSDPERAKRYDEGANQTIDTLAGLDVPSIAMIDGPCIGGGCLLAFACDLRIASDAATFAIPAGRLGLAYPYPALERLVELFGEARVLDLVLTGRTLAARDAHGAGLVHYLAAARELETETRRLAGRIADNAPLTMRYLRLALRRRTSGRLAPETIEQLANACFASEDYAEGVAAFLEKRRPAFKGR